MRFALLGSGSRGNATLVEVDGTCLLVDCGFSLRELERRMLRAKRQPQQLTAILVTHEHTDHIKGVDLLCRKYNIPVWATHGTGINLSHSDGYEYHRIDGYQSFGIGDIEVQPFPVPHDAREPCQFVFSDGDSRLGMLTDTGSSTVHIENQLRKSDALLLECNHDETLLAEGDYPAHLKARVGGNFGHLSNEQAADLLACLDTSCLKHIVAAHLSEKNNRPALAREALSTVLNCEPQWVAVADQEQGLGWRTL